MSRLWGRKTSCSCRSRRRRLSGCDFFFAWASALAFYGNSRGWGHSTSSRRGRCLALSLSIRLHWCVRWGGNGDRFWCGLGLMLRLVRNLMLQLMLDLGLGLRLCLTLGLSLRLRGGLSLSLS